MKRATIAIVGAHGTGKTTLAKYLARNLDSRYFGLDETILLLDAARKCPLRVGEVSDRQSQEWIFAFQRQQEKEAQGLCILDGCLLSHLAYYEYWVSSNESLFQEARQAFGDYTIALFLPADPDLCIADELRPTNPEFQLNIDRRIRQLMALSGREVYMLPSLESIDRNLLALDIAETNLEKIYCKQKTIVLAFVISNGKLLISRRSEESVPSATNHWDVIGGTVEFGEQPSETVARECLEEAGIEVSDIELIPLPTSYVWQRLDGRFQSNILAYTCTCASPVGEKLISDDPKIAELKWIDLSKIKNFLFLSSLKPYIQYLTERYA